MKSPQSFLPVGGVLLYFACLPLAADTIYQANAQGKLQVIQRDAIVVHEDSSFVIYKHFDLQERRVEKVSLSQGSLPHTVARSKSAVLDQIVAIWKKFGYKAAVTDDSGKTTAVYDCYLDFYPPGGRGSLLESLPPRTSFAIRTDDGTPDEIDFNRVESVQIAGQRLVLKLRDGYKQSGQFLMPTDKPAEVRFLGITDQYNPESPDVFDFSVPLSKLKEIRFGG